MPSQFQLRDLVNHVIIGCVVMFLFFLFFFLLYPPGWSTAAHEWHSAKAELSDVLLLPILLVLVYVIGAIVPSWSSLVMFGTPKSLIFRSLKAVRVCGRTGLENLPQKDEIRKVFLGIVAARFKVCEDAPDKHYETLFPLALAHVLNQRQSMQQLDIERHFVLMHFNSRLCALFFFGFALSALGVLGSLLAKFHWISALGAGPMSFVFLTLLFYAVARTSATKAQQNCGHWQNLIIRSFIVMESSAPVAKPEREPGLGIAAPV